MFCFPTVSDALIYAEQFSVPSVYSHFPLWNPRIKIPRGFILINLRTLHITGYDRQPQPTPYAHTCTHFLSPALFPGGTLPCQLQDWLYINISCVFVYKQSESNTGNPPRSVIVSSHFPSSLATTALKAGLLYFYKCLILFLTPKSFLQVQKQLYCYCLIPNFSHLLHWTVSHTRAICFFPLAVLGTYSRQPYIIMPFFLHSFVVSHNLFSQSLLMDIQIDMDIFSESILTSGALYWVTLF